MKKMIVSAVLVALASPAFAQATPMLTQNAQSQGAYAAQNPVRWHRAQAAQQYWAVAPGTVIERGRIVGADPDPNVRLELRRDPVADY